MKEKIKFSEKPEIKKLTDHFMAIIGTAAIIFSLFVLPLLQKSKEDEENDD